MNFPPHIRDQIDAAIAHRDKLMDEHGIAEVSAGLTARRNEMVETSVAAWKAAGEKMCVHLAEATGPKPFYLALGDPVLLMCGPCYTAYSQTLNSVEDRTCDLCHRYRPEGLYATAVTSELLTLLGGVCTDCAGTT